MGKFEFDKTLGVWALTSSTPPVSTERPRVEPIESYPQGLSTGYKRSVNFSGTEEVFLSQIKTSEKTENSSGDRSWSVVDSQDTTMSLSFIITKIIEGYGKDKYEIKELPEEWERKIFTTKYPAVQNTSDWAFFVDMCRKNGHRIVRENHGRTFRFIKESDGIHVNPPYRVALHSYGGDIYDLDFLHKKIDENPTFIIKDGLEVTVSTDTGFVPQIKQYLDDEGQSKIVINVPDGLSSFLSSNHTLMYEKLESDFLANRAGTLTGESKKFFDAVNKKNPTTEDWLRYYKVEAPDYNSNDQEDEGYTIHPYEGWESSFVTQGNMWATPGEWLTIEGTSSNLYFPFQVKGVTHVFSHKWETQYELVR